MPLFSPPSYMDLRHGFCIIHTYRSLVPFRCTIFDISWTSHWETELLMKKFCIGLVYRASKPFYWKHSYTGADMLCAWGMIDCPKSCYMVRSARSNKKLANPSFGSKICWKTDLRNAHFLMTGKLSQELFKMVESAERCCQQIQN